MQQQTPDRDSSKRSELSSPGCFMPLLAGLWVLVIGAWMRIGADRYQAPYELKLVVTIGDLAAIVVMLYPFRGKRLLTWMLGIGVILWAALDVMVIWVWN